MSQHDAIIHNQDMMDKHILIYIHTAPDFRSAQIFLVKTFERRW
ncbi:hypothetical protein GALL_361130 [mine drainage metagenome]|uniref:Uncharacterized protein n=1 Tax=mine drainage metagenome TaxID=410659 RepID=A0A1J5QXB8_9ZZZZ